MVGAKQGQVSVTQLRYILDPTVALAVVTLLFLSHSAGIFAESQSESLAERITCGDPQAFHEAADPNRKDLIPLIERFPDYNARKKALAKLGVKEYLDEILIELTNTSSTVVASGRGMNSSIDYARLSAQTEALKKLAYIKNRSTVKLIAAFLYGKENADDYIVKSDSESNGYWYCMLIYERPSETAMKTLAQIVDNPPAGNDVKVWQQWWEQNKDKYP
jgi:hypothetical protein